MPHGKGFSSKQQAKFAFATGQPWAERWAKENKRSRKGGIKSLPKRVKSATSRKRKKG